MRCRACDKKLAVKEIRYNENIGRWEDCTECLWVASRVFGQEIIIIDPHTMEELYDEYL